MQMRTSGRTHACYGGTNATRRNLDLTPNLKYETMVVESSHSSKSHFMSKSQEPLETVQNLLNAISFAKSQEPLETVQKPFQELLVFTQEP